MKHKETYIELWVKQDFFDPTAKMNPLIQHLAQKDDKPEHQFYQPLIDWLNAHVKVSFFDKLEEAGKWIVLPHPVTRYIGWEKMDEVKAFHAEAIKQGKTPIIIEDGWEYRPQDGEFLLANALYKGYQTPDAVITPLWGYDNGHLSYQLDKPSTPTVNFMGATEYDSRYNRLLFKHFQLPRPLINFLATKPWFKNRSFYHEILFWRKVIAKQVRKEVVKEMRRLKDMKVSVVERNATFFELPKAERIQMREEYVEAMASHAYTVISRGDANCAYTFYEILSFGRIPVWIDTGTVFPDLGEGLDYEDFSIIIPFKELHTLEERISEFHSSMDPEQFQRACRLARKAYESLLPHKFIPSLVHSLQPSTQTA